MPGLEGKEKHLNTGQPGLHAAYLIGVPAVALAGDVVCPRDTFQVLRQPDLLAVWKEKKTSHC